MRKGGPQLGSAPQQRLPKDWLRSEGLRVTFRPGEFEDLRELASQWRVPLATAVWAIVHGQLASYRRSKVRLGPAGAALGAAIATLKQGSDASAGPAAGDTGS